MICSLLVLLSLNLSNFNTNNVNNMSFLFFGCSLIPTFDIICKNHSKELIAYCPDCKCNICEDCLKTHPGNTHNVKFFTEIGLSENESEEIDKLIKEIDDIKINSKIIFF